jgi:hypothetical protein
VNENGRIDTHPAAAVTAKEVGDYTKYFYTVAEIDGADGQMIYVALGGYGYAPNCGGFFPRQALLAFDEFVNKWYAEELPFHTKLSDLPEFNYMLSKQRNINLNRWDMCVAWVIAWLRFISDDGVDWAQDEEVLQIIGALYHDDHAAAAPILVRLGLIEAERVA